MVAAVQGDLTQLPSLGRPAVVRVNNSNMTPGGHHHTLSGSSITSK
jgi:hypothetical protein